jgi:hypothetical protein
VDQASKIPAIDPETAGRIERRRGWAAAAATVRRGTVFKFNGLERFNSFERLAAAGTGQRWVCGIERVEAIGANRSRRKAGQRAAAQAALVGDENSKQRIGRSGCPLGRKRFRK